MIGIVINLSLNISAAGDVVSYCGIVPPCDGNGVVDLSVDGSLGVEVPAQKHYSLYAV